MLLVVHFQGAMHLGSLNSTEEGRVVASDYASSNSYASNVISRLRSCTLTC